MALLVPSKGQIACHNFVRAKNFLFLTFETFSIFPIAGFSEYSIIPARYAYILKTDLDPELACLLEREYALLFLN